MHSIKDTEKHEKRRVTLISVIAAVFLTGTKLIVGLLTGSLGILSEAMHSGLDLVATLLTLFAVRIADKPADNDHHFGHGKVENLSALIETLLLLVTCVWIVYEAIERITGNHVQIVVNFWSFAVVIVSIIIDFSRSRSLMKVAKKYNNQALEADALHFSTDIASSIVVLIGLVGAMLNYHIADSIAAMIVAILVIFVSFRLGKKSVDALLDRTPQNIDNEVYWLISQLHEVSAVHSVKVRPSGSQIFIELTIHVNPNLDISQAHEISEYVENLIKNKINRTEVHVHVEPEETKD